MELLAEHGLTFDRAVLMARAVGSTHAALFDWLGEEDGWKQPVGFIPELDARLAAAFHATPAIEG